MPRRGAGHEPGRGRAQRQRRVLIKRQSVDLSRFSAMTGAIPGGTARMKTLFERPRQATRASRIVATGLSLGLTRENGYFRASRKREQPFRTKNTPCDRAGHLPRTIAAHRGFSKIDAPSPRPGV
jgi:hypothetical protein